MQCLLIIGEEKKVLMVLPGFFFNCPHSLTLSAIVKILFIFVQVHDLSHLVGTMGEGPFSTRYRKLTERLCEVIPHSDPAYIGLQTSVSRLHICENMQHIAKGLSKGSGRPCPSNQKSCYSLPYIGKALRNNFV